MLRSSSPAQAGAPLISLRGITKRFPGLVANNSIDLDVFGGEVHAVLGENGAGKSTLMKIVYGFYQPDAGTVLVNGVETRITSPKVSRELGIGMVFQSFALVSAMTVAENIALFLPDQGVFLDRRGLKQRIAEVSERYGLEVAPDVRVADLSIGERQRVELVKLIMAHAEVLICDEPTSVLAPHEVEGLFRVFQDLKRDGYAILFITHKLNEVLACADRITVLRRGAVVGSMPGKAATVDALVAMMFGSALPERTVNDIGGVMKKGTAALAFANVSAEAKGSGAGLRDVSVRVMPGEIVGVAGVSGNGQAELGEVLVRMRREQKGIVQLFGEDVSGWSTAKVLAAGVSYVPEDVTGMASVPEMRVDENLVLGEVDRLSDGRIAMDWAAIHRQVADGLAGFPLALPRTDAAMQDLSGGNVQRVVLARELSRDPKVIVAYYPTRGLDVNTAESTRKLLLSAKERNAAVLLISEDLEELFNLSDRLAVMYQGRIVGEFRPKETSLHEVGLLMTGYKGE